MITLLKEADSFICSDCGQQFTIPENGDLCPNCYGDNISHYVNELDYVPNFYGRSQSVSYSVRDKHPIPDCKCFIIAMDSCYGAFGWWDGKQCNMDRQAATLFATKNDAKKKIQFSKMYEYCHPRVEEVTIINNEIV